MSLPPLPEPLGTVEVDQGRFDVGMARLVHYEKGYGADQMHAHAAAARLAALEEVARMLDREHEARKHIDNHAAFYARKIRELAIHVPPTCIDSGEK